MNPLQSIVVNIVIGQLVGAVKEYGATLNLAQLKASADAALERAIPWHYAEAKAETLVNGIIDALDAVLEDETDIETLAKNLAGKDWDASLATVKSLITANWKPTDPAGQQLAALLKV
jgi:hypothetical protein